MKVSKILGLVFLVLIGTISSANAVSLADCISVSSGEFKKGTFETTYEVSIRNACGDTVKDQLNYSSISFYADSSVLNPETQYIYYLQSYGQDFSFKLRNLKSGNFRPYLKISVPKDYSYRTVYLPGFSISDPLNCISLYDNKFINDRFNQTLRITLKNTCSDISSSEFSGIQLSLSIPGYYQYINSQSVYSLANYGKDFDFNLQGIKSGTYYPVLEIRNSSYQTRKINLDSIYISIAPSPTPTKSSSNGSSGKYTQICSTSKEFDDQCAVFPSFSFDFCSSLQKGVLYEKVGTKWVFLWAISGTRDSSICSGSKYPYYIIAEGENRTGKKTDLKIVFTKTSKISSYSQLFTLRFQ